jgi:hypothetical protein
MMPVRFLRPAEAEMLDAAKYTGNDALVWRRGAEGFSRGGGAGRKRGREFQ